MVSYERKGVGEKIFSDTYTNKPRKKAGRKESYGERTLLRTRGDAKERRPHRFSKTRARKKSRHAKIKTCPR